MKSNTIRNFKQKDATIRKISINYKKVMFFENGSVICEGEEDNYLMKEEFYKKIKSKVDYILMHMERELSMIIYNEYFSKKVENWWIYYFSRSTYYRLKNKAMNDFLEWWYA